MERSESNEEDFGVQMAAALTKNWMEATDVVEQADLMVKAKYFVTLLKEKLRSRTDDHLNTTRCLQLILRIEAFRKMFYESDGIRVIVLTLRGTTSFQLQYQLIFCLWYLTFSPEIASKATSNKVIQTLANILSQTTKEKVTRIILATFRNILHKVQHPEIKRGAGLQMVQHKVLKTLEVMDTKKYDDPELQADIEFIKENLLFCIQDSSSFDEYCSEVRSGHLHWSPVHKCIDFWRENVFRFKENDFELLKLLIDLLRHNEDPLSQCVATHDLGNYVAYYPEGKQELEDLRGKEAIMALLGASDSNVRYQALIAIQKIITTGKVWN